MWPVAGTLAGEFEMPTIGFGNPGNHGSSKVTASKGCSRVINFMLEMDFKLLSFAWMRVSFKGFLLPAEKKVI